MVGSGGCILGVLLVKVPKHMTPTILEQNNNVCCVFKAGVV